MIGLLWFSIATDALTVNPLDIRVLPGTFPASREGNQNMEIKERIDSCLAALQEKQHSVTTFQAKLNNLIDSLKVGGMKSGKLSELLQTLETVLKDYSEIGVSCREMIDGLRDIGSHVDHIESGRRKILDGVDAMWRL